MPLMRRPAVGRPVIALLFTAGAWSAQSCDEVQPLCSPASCGGCCSTLGACVPVSLQGFAECGAGGAACGGCGAEQICFEGACTFNPGSHNPMDSGPNCGSLGEACCTSLVLCAPGLACRGGRCEPPAPPPDGGSRPDAGNPPDAGQGTDSGVPPGTPTGGACTQDGTCAGGICIHQAAPGANGCPGPATCWPGGYCTEGCGVCAPGSACSVLSLNATTICLETCTTPLGQDRCRNGYVCDRGWLPDPTAPACIYACQAPRDCGASGSFPVSCVGGFCCGVTNFSCCGGMGGSCTTGTCGADGYCH
jgi:hypothetical protein